MFQDRFEAAKKLVPLLAKYKSAPDALVVAIPRGGIELGYILAQDLQLPLDVIFTKKIGLPSNPEYAIGAVSDRHVFISDKFRDASELKHYIEQEVDKIRKIIKERNKTYRKNMPPFDIANKTVIVVDDGVATGKTMLVTLELLREYKPKKIIVAIPVASLDALKSIEKVADEVVCLMVPSLFWGVSQFYKSFEQVDDQEAMDLLQKANA